MSNVVGFDLKPQPETSLKHMLEYGLNKHLQKYVLHIRLGFFSELWALILIDCNITKYQGLTLMFVGLFQDKQLVGLDELYKN